MSTLRKYLSPFLQSISRFLTRNEAVIIRTLLCIHPVADSCLIPASTMGYPVSPSFHLSNPSGSSLHRIFSYDLLNPSLKDSIDCLYHTEDELNLPLDEGFRARPSIGAAAILSQMNSDTPFWQRLFDAFVYHLAL